MVNDYFITVTKLTFMLNDKYKNHSIFKNEMKNITFNCKLSKLISF